VGHKRRIVPKKGITQAQKLSTEEASLAAKAWAEFLYDEYQLEKQKQLISDKKRTTMEKLTNHDKLNYQ
jgi:hypothetical protein